MTKKLSGEELLQSLLDNDKELKEYLKWNISSDGNISSEGILGELEYAPNVKVVDSQGGGEGGGEYCFTAIEYRGKYYRWDYTYYSYDGSNYELDSFYEVQPVERVVTFYE